MIGNGETAKILSIELVIVVVFIVVVVVVASIFILPCCCCSGTVTPLEFLSEFVELDLDDFVCVVNDPRNDYYKTYTVDKLQNVFKVRVVVVLVFVLVFVLFLLSSSSSSFF